MSLAILLDGYTPSIILALAAVYVILLCRPRLSVRLMTNEPPLLKPTILYIGPLIG
jgi:hypothetical protein